LGLSPNLLSGWGRSVGGDLDIVEEGSEQAIVTLQWLHHNSIGYQSVWHELTSLKRLIPASAIKNTSMNEEDAIWIADEWLSSEVGILQTVRTAKLFLTN
jgi:hypothetical protein